MCVGLVPPAVAAHAVAADLGVQLGAFPKLVHPVQVRTPEQALVLVLDMHGVEERCSTDSDVVVAIDRALEDIAVDERLRGQRVAVLQAPIQAR